MKVMLTPKIRRREGEEVMGANTFETSKIPKQMKKCQHILFKSPGIYLKVQSGQHDGWAPSP